MKALRESIIEVLVDGGLNKPSAENYEKAMYDASGRIDGGTPTKDTYSKFAYDKVGQLRGAKDRTEREKILSDIRKDVEGWDACVYEDQRKAHRSAMDVSVLKPKAVKGLYKCKNPDCKSDEFYTWSLQVNSSDEGMRHFRACAKCGQRGKE
jgi:DNA-directed RNA polymerase subunit M/transcription elongation factor TFIIS